MPRSDVIFYQEEDVVLLKAWLKTIPVRAQAKCLVALTRLETEGHALRRPMADFLRDGIYELRPSYEGVNYRILYFFAGKDVIVVSHGITKESKVPAAEINRALERKRKFVANPSAHGWRDDKA